MKLPKTISDLPDIPMHQIISLLSDTEVVYFGKAMADVLDNEPGLWNNIFRRRWKTITRRLRKQWLRKPARRGWGWPGEDFLPTLKDIDVANVLVQCNYLSVDTIISKAASIAEHRYLWNDSKPSWVSSAAALAITGYLPAVSRLWLNNLNDYQLDLMDPGELRALVRCVTGKVELTSVSGDPSLVLREVRCEWLYLDNITLDQSATMALMDAMDSRVEELMLGNVEMAELLGRYDGQGKCRKVVLAGATMRKSRHDVCQWAKIRNWECEMFVNIIVLRRK